jgi:nucleoside-diphosphate-sugar epimerase/predicted dehydrogenase
VKKDYKTIKIGIVGCGLNSDYHISFSRDYPGSKIVGVVDKDENNAKKCSGKYNIQNNFSRIEELVEFEKPDVIHIVTPPHTHFPLAKEAIQLGCHVLVEKPMALNLKEARKLFEYAQEHGVLLCTMHNHFLDPCMVKARELIQAGKVGKIINIESYYGMNTKIDTFRKYPAPNVLPWIYSLPGGVFHDFMVHPLYVMLPYVGVPQTIQVMEKSFGELPQNMSDELRIIVKGDQSFGVLTFSFASKPHQHFVKIYGTKMMIHINFDTMTTTRHPVSHLPKAAQKATYNLSESWQLFTNTISNVWNFGRGKLRPYQGMKILIHRFYDAIKGKGEIPVSKEDALNVIKIMDEIWQQVRHKHLSLHPIIPNEKTQADKTSPKILVTGSTGFLGSRLVELLIQRNYPVRALARKLSNIEKLKELQAEIFFGDVADIESLKSAFEGVDMVVHAAADTKGSEEDGQVSTIQGTKNVIDLCQQCKIKKLVYISSCSVYGVADFKKGEVVNEESSLERYPERRGHYSYSKYHADRIIIEAMSKGGLPIVCLRPGTIFGPGGEIFTPMMGFALGQKVFAIIGSGNFVLPLVYIDNLVSAIIAAIEKEQSIGKIYNIVDSDNLTKKQYIELLLKKLYPNAKYFYIPYSLFYVTVFIQEILIKMLKRKPFLTRYRLISSQKNISYNSTKIQRELNWTPKYSLRDSIEKILQYELGEEN